MKVFFKRLIIQVYEVFVSLNFYLGAAIILCILTKPLSKRKKYRVLTLGKPIFNEDLKNINRLDGDLQFLLFPRLLLSSFIKRRFQNFEELNDGSYHLLLDNTVEQKKIFSDIKKTFYYINKILKIDAIFTGNYVYVSQQELFKVAGLSNIPVIVLYKEGMFLEDISPKIAEKLYKNKRFLGSKILFYNEPIKQKLIDSKIPGITEDTSEVVGIPRLDNYFNDYKDIKENKFVLFAFDALVKYKNLVDSPEHKDQFIERCNEFQNSIFTFCKENNYPLIIKVKDSPSEMKNILSILKIDDIRSLPDHIEIIKNKSSLQLVSESKFVAGYASTTLLEGMILDRYLLSPGFDDILENHQLTYIDRIEGAVNYVNHIDDFNDIINVQDSYQRLSREVINEKIKKMIFSSDGKSSERVYESIIRSIKNDQL